jgi:hypothetical protein
MVADCRGAVTPRAATAEDCAVDAVIGRRWKSARAARRALLHDSQVLRSSVATVALATALIGCGSESSDSTGTGAPAGCAPGEQRDDGTCWAAGLPADMLCLPGEWADEAGTCFPAGVPPDGCGDGFSHDGDRGCIASLPAGACPKGLMAVPGETACREIAACGSGAWGDIPIDADTEHVDASYLGVDSDGSPDKPWTTIQAAVDVSAAGAIVAIAEGSYAEDVLIEGSSVRLWGRCPSLVEVVGTGASLSALGIFEGADGTVVRGLAVRGGGHGLLSSGSTDVVLDQIWVHDSDGRGLVVHNESGASAVTMRGSLVEQNRAVGVFATGASVTLESSVVRDIQKGISTSAGIVVQSDAGGAPGSLSLIGSVLDHNPETGIFVYGSEATIDASVVRDTQPDATGQGRGLNVQSDPSGSRGVVLLTRSVVERSHAIGVFAASADLSIEATVIRDTQPESDGDGRGVSVQHDPGIGSPSTLLITRSLVDRSREIGVFVAGSAATVEATAVRSTAPDAIGENGEGIHLKPDPASGTPSTLLLRSSLIEQSHQMGVFLFGSEATVEATAIRDTHSTAGGRFGTGVHAQFDPERNMPSSLTLLRSSVERSREAGILVVGSVATVDASVIRDTMPSDAGGSGDGILVVSYYQQSIASVEVTSTHIDKSVRAGLATFGARAALRGSGLTCQAFALDFETYDEVEADLLDLGDNRCGCPDPVDDCVALSSGLEPPSALEPEL